ncbi:mobile mystery protein B [Flavobacterium columnare]|uniref:Mobile mystery protein B n=1 Tax=Flavobacterium columnare TaxID=996 RepID=A0AAI8CJW0_9FLAO|nr:mobile mystery protein B [Flavobacterium columnare]AMO21306.1 mobile mystery protein B [Flavobacterium columnare]AUX19330.1 cell filamentation protein Fic [Flavobacterium columnare]QOG58418.1 mobile mystery protein B [Flavobacterium columnare]QOG61141.1 mobile mystery protein B [Flavobacterium columnare]QOG63863.1 mobile mystery protein B [Flavobacterium columnare]
MGLTIDYINGQTPLSEEEMEGLKIPSITTRKELDEFEQLNIEKAIEWTLRAKLKPEQLFSEKFIKDLHKKMYGDVWKWAGNFRNSEKNIGIKSYMVTVALKQLLDDALFWFQNNTYPQDEMAIRFKHRLVSIHCFPNGNGRHSRLIADLIVTKLYNANYFTWGKSNLVQANETRTNYIKALREADNQNFTPLIVFAKS